MNPFHIIRNSIRKQKSKIERWRRWSALRSEFERDFGADALPTRLLASELVFLRWNMIFGRNILQAFGLRNSRYIQGIINHFDTVDVESPGWAADAPEGWINIAGILFPKPLNRADEMFFVTESADIVIPYVLSRRCPEYGDFYSRIRELAQMDNWVEGSYESDEHVRLREGDVVFDCGANLGLFSGVASHCGCSVYAFEAIPSTIERYLSKTATLHPRITICPNAVWDKEEEIKFIPDDDLIGNASAVLEQPASSREAITVAAITLDHFVERQGIERVDFIKADIEGAERNMLRGAKNILRRFAPKLSICTYHLPDDPEVLREIILDANPEYVITQQDKKMYAYVPGKRAIARAA